jgi:RNA polymerase sigma-70 factor (ECF subfamily)
MTVSATERVMSTAEAAVSGGTSHTPCGEELAATHRAAVSTLDAIYEAHFRFVWRTLRRMGVATALLDDATQDVFIVAHRQLASFEGRSSLKTWLCAIALRVAHDYRRSAKRRGWLVPFRETNTPSTRPTPLEHVQQVEAAGLLNRFLDSLDESKRVVFILSELEEMTAPEISRAVGASVNTIYARLRTARRLFVEAVRSERAKERGVIDE